MDVDLLQAIGRGDECCEFLVVPRLSQTWEFSRAIRRRGEGWEHWPPGA